MAIRKASARTTVNSGVTAAAAATVNAITTAPATATVVAGGGTLGGVSISNVSITDSTFANVLSGDTAVSSSGGFVRITGTGFKTAANVLLGSTTIANTFVNSTQINANVPASSVGTYQLTIFNTDGSGVRYVPSITVSGPPSWSTTSYVATSVNIGNIQLLASGDAPLTYYIQPGSANPENLSVNAEGYLSGTVSAESSYTITVVVDDAQAQSTQADITVTVSAADPYFYLNSLLLSADGTNNANNQSFIDSSTNNFTVTRNGNATQGTFSPYGTNWSNYFDGTGDYLTAPSNVAFALGTGDFTVEGWFLMTVSTDNALWGIGDGNVTGGVMFRYEPSASRFNFYSTGDILISGTAVALNTWHHIAVVRASATLRVYLNGTQYGSGISNSTNLAQGIFYIGGGKVGVTVPYNPHNGYISNLRVVKGTAVYTSNFTPSTAPLSAIANTSLLTCQSNRFIDNSTNAFTITRNGDVSVQRMAPFANATEYQSGTIGGSGYFDGTGDYLTVPDNAALESFTDFTIECWVYFNTLAGTQTIVDKGWNGATFAPYLIFKDTNGLIQAYGSSGSTWDVIPGSNFGTVTTGQWYHLAMTRSGSTIRLFFNGALSTTVTNGTTLMDSASALGIGGGPSAGNGPLNGYISGLRIVKGTAVYTAAFTPPTAPPTAIANTSLLINFTNAAIFDATGRNIVETANQTKLSTAVKKYGTASIVFDGADDYVVAPYSPLFNLSTGAFTIEGWVYFNVLSGNRMIFDTYTSAALGGGYQLYWRSIGTSITLYGNGVVIAQSSFTGHVTGTWYHIACTRDESGNVRIFVDGTKYADTPYTTALNIATTARPAIGIQYATLTNDLDGYIDDFRLTLGFARYTANFTAPTQAAKIK